MMEVSFHACFQNRCLRPLGQPSVSFARDSIVHSCPTDRGCLCDPRRSAVHAASIDQSLCPPAPHQRVGKTLSQPPAACTAEVLRLWCEGRGSNPHAVQCRHPGLGPARIADFTTLPEFWAGRDATSIGARLVRQCWRLSPPLQRRTTIAWR